MTQPSSGPGVTLRAPRDHFKSAMPPKIMLTAVPTVPVTAHQKSTSASRHARLRQSAPVRQLRLGDGTTDRPDTSEGESSGRLLHPVFARAAHDQPYLRIELSFLRAKPEIWDLHTRFVVRRGECELTWCRCRRCVVGSLTLPFSGQAVWGDRLRGSGRRSPFHRGQDGTAPQAEELS